MSLSLKNISIGMTLGLMCIIGLFVFTGDWATENQKTMSADASSDLAMLNDTFKATYSQVKDDFQTSEESSVFTGGFDIGIVSTDAFRVIKNTFKTTKTAMNMTTSMTRSLEIPDWFRTTVMAILMTTITFLFIAAVFRVGTGGGIS
jgi:hypothetical protein